MELSGPLSAAELTAAVEKKLLSRFPRFRGHVTEDEKHWRVPEAVDPRAYVEEVELTAPTAADEATALREHVQREMAKPLPPRCSWNAHLITYSGRAAKRCTVLWRISHTVADGVVLAQIMSRVICEEIPVVKEVPKTTEETMDGKTTTAAPTESEATVLRRRVPRAGLCERIWRFLCGVAFVFALVFWPSDPHTPLQLGPYRWKQQQEEGKRTGGGGNSTHGGESATSGAHAAGEEGVRIALGEPIAVSALRAAAAAAGVTINDLLMTAKAAALRKYLTARGFACSDSLKLTAVAVINPRPTMPQDMSSQELLADYTRMKGPGCDITLLLLPLPCGDMSPSQRRATLSATTRRLKLSPEAYLLRLGANLLTWTVGLNALIALYTIVLSKFTLYVSNVVAPAIQGAFCGVPIDSIWFGTTPLDFGVSFSFLSYAGYNRVCCVADGHTVPEPQVLTDMVVECLLEQMEDIKVKAAEEVAMNEKVKEMM